MYGISSQLMLGSGSQIETPFPSDVVLARCHQLQNYRKGNNATTPSELESETFALTNNRHFSKALNMGILGVVSSQFQHYKISDMLYSNQLEICNCHKRFWS